MEEPKIIVNTTMSREDYRKFLFIATFRRNKFVVPFIGLISLIASLIVSFEYGVLDFTRLIISWVILFSTAIAVVVLKLKGKMRNE